MVSFWGNDSEGTGVERPSPRFHMVENTKKQVVYRSSPQAHHQIYKKKMNQVLLNHTIKCLNPDCIESKIQTTLEGDSGYSNWTVEDSGFVEFKCHGCGKFGSSDKYKTAPNNQLSNFEVKCKLCGSTEWTPNIQDVDGEEEPTNVECKNCHAKSS